MGWIYKITNVNNGHVYIGQTRRDVDIRWKEHLKTKERYDSAFARALKKYPESCFVVETIEEVPDALLDDRERHWIKHYGSYDEGYNSTLGGESRRLVDYNAVREMWCDGLSVSEISKTYGCGKTTVARILHADDTYSPEEAYRRGEYLNGREVVKYGLDGGFLHVYDSIAEAARDIGGDPADITNACRGNILTASGFQWRYIEDEAPGTYHNPRYTAVDQYDLEGNYIRSFDSIVSASMATDIHDYSISANCRGDCKRAGGYQWRYAGDEPPERYKIKSIKPVVRCDLDWNPLELYPSMAAAARELDIDISSICACCNGRKKTYKGYRWRYAE